MDKERMKCDLLQNEWLPSGNDDSFTGKGGRKFQPQWVKVFPWLTFSYKLKGVLCKYCAIFKSKDSLVNKEFVTVPFKDFKNALGKKRGALPKHDSSAEHQESASKAEAFMAVLKDNSSSILQKASNVPSCLIAKNNAIMLAIIDVIYTLGVKGIALRGCWDKSKGQEDGCFVFFLEWIAKRDAILAKHLCSGPANGKYTSPTIQNEIIQSIGSIVLKHLVSEINQSKFISVMADETTDVSSTEQLALCIRYLKTTETLAKEIVEVFVGFVKLPNTKAKTIADAILVELKRLGIDTSRLVGQGYDGASNMAGSKGGVQKLMSDELPNCKYFTHCRSHCLNLAVVASCKDVPDVRNFMDKFGSVTWFFNGSAKRKELLRDQFGNQKTSELLADIDDSDLDVVDEGGLISKSLMRHSLPTLSDTRWLSRVDSVSTLLGNYESVYKAMVNVRDQSTGSSSSDAQSYINTMEQFQFIVSAVVCQHVLAFIRPLSVLLQGHDKDILSAYNDCQELILVLKEQRNDGTFSKLFSRAVAIAKFLDVEPTKPRACSLSLHRFSLDPSCSAETYFRVSLYYAFVDHAVSYLSIRFPESSESIYMVSQLLPPLASMQIDSLGSRLIKEFGEYLPMPDSLQQELIRWCTRSFEKPYSLISIINQTNALLYPNISSILYLLAALPVGSCSCERSFSALRRLKTWQRSSMSEERLSCLALLNILQKESCVSQLDFKDVLHHWDASGNRRIKLI